MSAKYLCLMENVSKESILKFYTSCLKWGWIYGMLMKNITPITIVLSGGVMYIITFSN